MQFSWTALPALINLSAQGLRIHVSLVVTASRWKLWHTGSFVADLRNGHLVRTLHHQDNAMSVTGIVERVSSFYREICISTDNYGDQIYFKFSSEGRDSRLFSTTYVYVSRYRYREVNTIHNVIEIYIQVRFFESENCLQALCFSSIGVNNGINLKVYWTYL